jgi:hypothetical protein
MIFFFTDDMQDDLSSISTELSHLRRLNAPWSVRHLTPRRPSDLDGWSLCQTALCRTVPLSCMYQLCGRMRLHYPKKVVLRISPCYGVCKVSESAHRVCESRPRVTDTVYGFQATYVIYYAILLAPALSCLLNTQDRSRVVMFVVAKRIVLCFCCCCCCCASRAQVLFAHVPRLL